MYECKFIICLDSEGGMQLQANLLKRKWVTSAGDTTRICHIIVLDESHNPILDDALFHFVDPNNVKIAILGHCARTDPEFMQDSKSKTYSVTELSIAIKTLHDLASVITTPAQPLSVSLISCNSGYKKDKATPSLAENLHRALFCAEIFATVTARKSIVYITYDGRKLTLTDRDTERYHQLRLLKTPEAAAETDKINRQLKEVHAPGSKVRVSHTTESKSEAYEPLLSEPKPIIPTAEMIERSLVVTEKLKPLFERFSIAYRDPTFKLLFEEISKRRHSSYKVLADIITSATSLIELNFDELDDDIYSDFTDQLRLFAKEIAMLDSTDEESKSASTLRT